MEKTVFQKIINRELPAEILYEDEQYIVIKSIKPMAPIHYLFIPKKLIVSIPQARDEDGETIGALLLLARTFAKERGIHDYKLAFNAGKYLHVPHLHLHFLAGEDLDDVHSMAHEELKIR